MNFNIMFFKLIMMTEVINMKLVNNGVNNGNEDMQYCQIINFNHHREGRSYGSPVPRTKHNSNTEIQQLKRQNIIERTDGWKQTSTSSCLSIKTCFTKIYCKFL